MFLLLCVALELELAILVYVLFVLKKKTSMTYWSCTDGPGEPLCTDDPCKWWAPRRRRCGSIAGRKKHMAYGIWLVAGGVGASPAEKTYGIWHMDGCWLLVAVCCHGTRVGMGMATKNIWHMAYMAVDVARDC